MSQGKTTTRGYGTAHQKLRKQWAPKVATGQVACARCGYLIQPGTAWDLGHVDGDRSRYWGPEHARCNRGATAKVRERRRRMRRVLNALVVEPTSNPLRRGRR
jgi:hypothetical protein